MGNYLNLDTSTLYRRLPLRLPLWRLKANRRTFEMFVLLRFSKELENSGKEKCFGRESRARGCQKTLGFS